MMNDANVPLEGPLGEVPVPLFGDSDWLVGVPVNPPPLHELSERDTTPASASLKRARRMARLLIAPQMFLWSPKR
jgi:hypothetical protein